MAGIDDDGSSLSGQQALARDRELAGCADLSHPAAADYTYGFRSVSEPCACPGGRCRCQPEVVMLQRRSNRPEGARRRTRGMARGSCDHRLNGTYSPDCATCAVAA